MRSLQKKRVFVGERRQRRTWGRFRSVVPYEPLSKLPERDDPIGPIGL